MTPPFHRVSIAACLALAVAVVDADDPVLSTLIREPYLQRVSSSEATIAWASRESGPADVRYRPSAGGEWLVAAAATTFFPGAITGMAEGYYQHEARLTGLSAATTYTYDPFIGGLDATVGTDELTTAPPTGTGTVSFVAFGDSGSGSSQQNTLAGLLATQFGAGRWDFALHTGDVVYPSGTYQTLHDRFFDVYEPWLRRRPVFLALGNHDYYASEGQPYLDLFMLPENGGAPAYPNDRERYYSFDYGPVHVAVLDSQAPFMGTSRRQAQLTWLARDLEATTQPWRVVVMHVPAYGSFEGESSSTARQYLQPLFERYGVQLVLAGHQHVYARSTPWREGTTHNSPVVHVVTGGGGASLNDAPFGPWAVHAAKKFHVVSVTATDCQPGQPCELSMEAIGIDGVVFDRFTLPLRAQQQDVEPPAVDWLTPAYGATLSGTTNIAAAATDDQQVVKVDIRVDGMLRFVDASEPYSWSWDTSTDVNGPHTIELRAYDIGGRSTVSEERTVTVHNAPPSVALQAPTSTSRLFTTQPYRIQWAAGAGVHPLAAVRVEVSATGTTFTPLPGCHPLPPSARECLWSAPSPATSKGAVRVVVTDALGTEAASTATRLAIQSTTPTLVVTSPNTAINVGRGSSRLLTWSTNLGSGAPIRLELTRDGGTSWEPLAAIESGESRYRWLATGPTTTQARLAVSSMTMARSDASNVSFVIADPTLSVTAPTSSSTWRWGAPVNVKWSTNLGPLDVLNVRLSTDGGLTFPHLLAAAVPASAKSTSVTVPSFATTAARVRLEAVTNQDWTAVSPGTFRIQP